MIRIDSIDDQPMHYISYLNAGRSASDFKRELLPVYKASSSSLPDGVDAIVITADLQGLAIPSNQSHNMQLMGETIPTELESVLLELGLTDEKLIGALLGGDFYTYPDLKGRGGTGDVTEVWDEFIYHYDWVFGVAGNHDTFSDKLSVIPKELKGKLLDGDLVTQNGIKIGGLSGIIGNPKRNFRREFNEFHFETEVLLEQEIDILLMHDGPDGNANRYKGDSDIRELIESQSPTLVVRGHSHWPTPLVELKNGSQVLNVDATIVILIRENV